MIKANGGSDWDRGLRICMDALHQKDLPDAIQIRQAKDTFFSMLGGNGSFSDFYLWDDDFEIRKEKNERYTALLEEIMDILNAAE